MLNAKCFISKEYSNIINQYQLYCNYFLQRNIHTCVHVCLHAYAHTFDVSDLHVCWLCRQHLSFIHPAICGLAFLALTLVKRDSAS